MQANDSLHLINSYLDISSNILAPDSSIYEGEAEDILTNQRPNDTADLLGKDFALELERIKNEVSDDLSGISNLKAPRGHYVNDSKYENNKKNTSSYFNYIQNVGHKDTSNHIEEDSKLADLNESFGVVHQMKNNSGSFHYKPDIHQNKSHLKLQSISKSKPSKTPKQPSQERINDRSLSLPNFDTFNALPHIKQTADFSNPKREEKQNIGIVQTQPQESMHWEEDKIEFSHPQQQINDSLADSFLLEIAKSERVNRNYDTAPRAQAKLRSKNQDSSKNYVQESKR